jgi:hypothetical protein
LRDEVNAAAKRMSQTPGVVFQLHSCTQAVARNQEGILRIRAPRPGEPTMSGPLTQIRDEYQSLPEELRRELHEWVAKLVAVGRVPVSLTSRAGVKIEFWVRDEASGECKKAAVTPSVLLAALTAWDEDYVRGTIVF